MARVLARLSDAVKAAGVVEVDGDVVGDDSAFAWEPYPDDWAQDDLLWGYGAPVSALSLHDNQIAIMLRPGTVGEPVAVTVEDGLAGWLQVDASELKTGVTGGGTHIGIGALPGGARGVRVWGTIAAGTPELREEIAVEEPALFAAEMLRATLVKDGIRVNGVSRAEHRLPRATAPFREQVLGAPAMGLKAGGAPEVEAGAGRPRCCGGGGGGCLGQAAQRVPQTVVGVPQTVVGVPQTVVGVPQANMGVPRTLVELASPTVAEDVMATNKESLNLHAELLLERLGRTFGDSEARMGADARVLADAGSRAQGVRVVRSVLGEAGVDLEDVVLVDGSGLSTHDLVTPAAMTQLLVWSSRQSWFEQWKATLPVGGVDGTLAGRFTKAPLRGRVQAKTGTLGESRALAGYLRCASGRTVAFAVMVDGHTPGDTADRLAMDRMVEAIYRAE